MKQLLTLIIMNISILLLVFGIACGSKNSNNNKSENNNASNTATKNEENNLDRITIQHILIGFEGSVPGKPISRTQEEASDLANELLQRSRDGEDFDALVSEYTDDQSPGIYKMCNNGVSPQTRDEYPRNRMVKAFGDISFSLDVGEIGLAEYHPQNSPFGWHIIKRIK